ncbi:MAG: hypothetical protein MR802_10270 [Prevotella sp.]|nr:hypothetical protein [Prevotella sp.]
MAKKKNEKDVLIVRDEKTGENSVVAGLQADGSKVTDHHALLVTGEKPLFLSKEDELKQLKSELAALDRKIQLELAPPAPEVKQQEEKPDGEIHNLPNKTIDIRPEQNEQIYGRREIAEPVRRIRLG